MADIRINSLPTTATSTSFDDYVAVDGSGNGTRKLSAYSPTFGGNLTVSGTGSFGGAVSTLVSTNGENRLSNRNTSAGAAAYSSFLLGNDIAPNLGALYVLSTGFTTSAQYVADTFVIESSRAAGMGISTTNGGPIKFWHNGVNTATFTSSAATLTGNLTVSGAGGVNVASNTKFWALNQAAYYYIPQSGSNTGDLDAVNGIRLLKGGTAVLTAGNSTDGNVTVTNNLTVSGTGTSSFAGAVTIANTASTSSYQTGLRLQSTAGSAPNTIQALEFYSSSLSTAVGAIDALREAGSFASSLRFYSTTSGGALTERGRFNSSGNLLIGTTTDDVGKLQVNGSVTAYTGAKAVSGSSSLVLKSTDASALSGALTLYTNATGSSRYLKLEAFEQGFGGRSLVLQENGGSVLIATNVDSGNGKLQLATHTTSAGGIGFGTALSMYRSGDNSAWIDAASGNVQLILGRAGAANLALFSDGSYVYASAVQAGMGLIFRTNGSTTALTLDSSQNATFAGRVRAGTAVGTAKTVMIDAAFTTLLNVTKTFTVTMPSPSLASSFVLEVGVYGNTATGYASLMVKGGGYLGSSTLYEATELTKINSGSVTISSVTKASGSMTFTVINTSSSGHVAICYKQTSDDVFTTLPTITAV